MTRPVRLLDDAVADLHQIQEWGAGIFGAAHAVDFAERLLERLALLGTQPGMGRVGRVPETREWPLDGTPFLVIYRERPDSVEVLRVLHGARRWPPENPPG